MAATMSPRPPRPAVAQPSLPDWLLRTLKADVTAIAFRDRAQLPDKAAARLDQALRALIGVVEAVTYEADVSSRPTRRPFHDPSAAAALTAIARLFCNRAGFREEWTE
jgi:hypothetical protein